MMMKKIGKHEHKIQGMSYVKILKKLTFRREESKKIQETSRIDKKRK